MRRFTKLYVITLLILPIKALALTETDCLAYTLHREARGESLKSRRAVLDVLYNRMRIRGLSACAIMKQRSQFSWYRRGTKIKMDIDVLTEFWKVDSMPSILPRNAEYFHYKRIRPAWTMNLKRLATIGNHTFYAEKGIKA